MPKEFVRVMSRIYAQLPREVCIEMNFIIVRFDFSVIREGQTIFEQNVDGNRFSQEIKEALRNLQEGDNVCIEQVVVKYPDDSPTVFEGLKIEVE